MNELDLHGYDYDKANILVENFVFQTSLPAKIITGNSLPMQKIVQKIVLQCNLSWEYENFWNVGCMVITEKR